MVEARGAKAISYALGECLLVSEHDAFDDSSPRPVKAARDRVRERGAKPVSEAGKTATSAHDPPAIGAKNDVDALVSQPGPLVESTFRRARQTNRRDRLEQAALRRRATERKLEQDGLTEAKTAEAPHLRRNSDLETARAGGPGGHEERALGRVDSREQHAPVERIEAGAPPPPAREEQACGQERRPNRLLGSGRGDEEQGRPDGRAEERETGHVGARHSQAERRDEDVRRVSGAAHGTTRSRSWSSRLGPIPGTASSSSTELNAPCFVR